MLEDRCTPSIYFANELLIQYAPGVDPAVRADALSATGASLISDIHTSAMQTTGQGVLQHVRLPDGMSVEEAIQHYSAQSGVVFAEPNYVMQRTVVSDDPYYVTGSRLWGMYSDDSPTSIGPAGTTNQYGIHAEKAWNDGHIGSRSIYVGVIDEGIQVQHPDLDANCWTNPFDPIDGVDNDGNGRIDDINGWDFFNNDNSVYDSPSTDSHGTHVAGTIGAEGGNATGVVGVNWRITMISAKFLQGSGSTANAIRAIDYLTDLKQRHNLNIVATNNSWGGGGASTGLHAAINRSAKAGILFIAAAGNANNNNDASPFYPANYSTLVAAGSESAATYEAVISVASITSTGARSSFSSYGANTVDIGAPGSGINSTVPNNTYASYNGTSMATPHVTGAAALYASVYPWATAKEIRDALLTSATPTSSLSGITVTGGRLNIHEALKIVPPGPPIINDSDLIFTSSPVDEGSSIRLDGSFVDPTPNETHEVVINWGDGNSDTINLAANVFTFSATHVYVDNRPGNAPYTVNVTVRDAANLSDSAKGSVTVLNVVPRATINGAPSDVDEGSLISLTSTVTDPGILDTHTYFWSVTKDGAFYNPLTPQNQTTFSFAPRDNGIFVVGLSVTDKDNGVGNATPVTITVHNVAPTASITGAPANSNEGSAISLGHTKSDPGSADTFTYSWSVTKDGNFYDPGTPTDKGTFTFTPDDNGVFVVSLTVTDDDGGAGDATPVSITVHNVAPTATFGNDGPTGVDLPVTISFTNPNDVSSVDMAAGLLFSFDLNNDGDFNDFGELEDVTQTSIVTVFDTLGTYTVRGVVKDKDGGATTLFTDVVINRSGNNGVVSVRTHAAAKDAGDDPHVRVFNSDGSERFSLFAYDYLFSGGVRVATGDVDGDGIEDLITAPGAGGGPHIKVFSGADGSLLRSFLAFSPAFTGGVWVASGDVNKDGFWDIIVGAGAGGGPHVKVISGRKNMTLLKSFSAYDPRFAGGVSVASGDVNGDGFFEIITAPGPSTKSFVQGPLVKVYNGNSGFNPTLLKQFLAFESFFSNGLTIAAGDVNKDGHADIIVGTMARARYSSKIRVVDGATLTTSTPRNIWNFVVSPGHTGGVRVAADDLDGDGHADILFTLTGSTSGRVVALSGKNLGKLRVFNPFDPSFLGGIHVG